MSTNGTVMGCLVLQMADNPKLPPPDYPFTHLQKVEVGNHLQGYDSSKPAAFDFLMGGTEAEHAKVFVSTRALQLAGFRVGEETDDNLTRRCINHLLTLNTNPSEEDKKLTYLDLAFSKVFNKIVERSFLSLEITASAPKFVLMTRDMPVYLTGFCDNEAMYLMWSNEANVEDRMREFYGERFYYYRMKPFLNGMCVIQSVYLKKKIAAWSYLLQDKLKIMNALEVHLFRRLITESDPVNSQASI